jgi:hypothetical protein
MKTFTTLTNLFGSLSQNTSATNLALGAQLINDQHRYLIQKYFDNERTVTLSTVGAMDLAVTVAPSAGNTSATLTAPWAYQTCTQLVNFSSGEQRSVLFTNGSTAISWGVALNDAATVDIATVGVQAYDIPANVSKIINDTINVGQLKYQPIPVQSRAEWDMINFLPYTSDIPNYFFIYNGKLEIFPIPSTTGNVITFNYKTRISDLSFADYTTGNIAAAGATSGSTAVTGLVTNWSTTGGYPLNTDIGYYNLNLKINPPYGDGIWYPISNFTSNTALTLKLPIVNAPNITASTTYTIGQMPVLNEDFHDMLVYGALMTYFTSIVKDADKYKMYAALYESRLELLEAYAGTKSVNVDLGNQPEYVNPNLFYYAS